MTKQNLRKKIFAELEHRYRDWEDVANKKAINAAWQQYVDHELAETKKLQKMNWQDNNSYWQVFTEVLFANELIRVNLLPERQKLKNQGGPDFLVKACDQTVQIEAMCPEPKGLPEDWTKPPHGNCREVPMHAMFLRWTSALKKKVERGKDYLEKKILKENDCYVIAINGRLLRGLVPHFCAQSDLPFAVEACLGVTLQSAQADETSFYQPRRIYTEHINKNKSDVHSARIDTAIFWNKEFSFVSAIWAVDFDECATIEKYRNFDRSPMVIIHNPRASNPLPNNFLPSYKEFNGIPQIQERCGRT